MGTAPLPSPSVPGQHGELPGGGTSPPPSPLSGRSIDGIAAAQPAASAESSVEKCDPSPPGPGSEVNGPRAGRRAGARRSSIDGIAAAQPAASAKSSVEKCEPSPPGPGSEVNGPRAGRRAGGPAAAPRSGEVRAASRAVPGRRRRTQA